MRMGGVGAGGVGAPMGGGVTDVAILFSFRFLFGLQLQCISRFWLSACMLIGSNLLLGASSPRKSPRNSSAICSVFVIVKYPSGLIAGIWRN
jgi:hypothetical protein